MISLGELDQIKSDFWVGASLLIMDRFKWTISDIEKLTNRQIVLLVDYIGRGFKTWTKERDKNVDERIDRQFRTRD
jgi:hypothetical protein